MKKIFGITTMLVGAALLTAGCTSDNLEQQGQMGNKPIQLAVTTVELENSAIADGNTWSNSTTRALESDVWTAFANGDAIKAYIVKTGTTTAVPGTESGWTTYTYNGSAWTGSAHYPNDNSCVDLTAIYPSTIESTATSFTVEADQTSADNYKASDLLTYKGTNIFPEATLPVAMGHKMARIKVKINAASTVAVTDIAINNVQLSCGFTPTTGAIGSATGDAGTVTICGAATEDQYYCGVIPPQTHAASALITLTTATGSVTYTLGAAKAFDSGKEYTLDLTVNTAAIGTTVTITNWGTGDNTAGNMTVPVPPKPVDLGLPSGTLWANMNVGATSASDYGTYFAWGETTGLTVSGASETITSAAKTDFSWSTYKWGTHFLSLTKYNYSSDYGTVDNITTLEPADEAAYANWGGSWRMPTEAEFQELIDNTTNAWTDNYNQTGVAGYTFTGNGNSIFLPAAGYRFDTDFDEQGLEGYYWSSSLYTNDAPYNACSLYFNSSGVYVGSGSTRYYGYPVRPVQ